MTGVADIVNMAQAAWSIIKDNAPTTDIHGSTANAVPHVEDWQSITGAQGPAVYRWYYHVPYVDLPVLSDYDHVQIEVLLKWEYGARYRGGGAFIPNIWIEVPECYVGLGWHAEIDFTAHNPSNAGSETAPIARIPVSLAGTVHSALESYRVESSFMLFGDGNSTSS